MNTSPRSLLVADKMIPHCIETPCNSQTWSKLSKPFWQGPGRTWKTPQEVSMILIPCRWKFHPCPPPVLWLKKCAGRSRWPRLALAGIGVSSTAPHPEFFSKWRRTLFLTVIASKTPPNDSDLIRVLGQKTGHPYVQSHHFEAVISPIFGPSPTKPIAHCPRRLDMPQANHEFRLTEHSVAWTSWTHFVPFGVFVCYVTGIKRRYTDICVYIYNTWKKRRRRRRRWWWWWMMMNCKAIYIYIPICNYLFCHTYSISSVICISHSSDHIVGVILETDEGNEAHVFICVYLFGSRWGHFWLFDD